jgi:hypothetical protein
MHPRGEEANGSAIDAIGLGHPDSNVFAAGMVVLFLCLLIVRLIAGARVLAAFMAACRRCAGFNKG